MAICPSLCFSKKDKKEIKTLGSPPGGPLIKSFVDKAFDPSTSEKPENSSGRISRLYSSALMVSSGSLGWLFK